MKNKILVSTLSIMTLIITIAIPVFAQQGSLNDERVDYNYWDQPEIQTYWTGVYNKIDYNYYSPCVGHKKYQEGEIYCGPQALQGMYEEKSGTLYNGHSHSLLSEYGTFDYWVE